MEAMKHAHSGQESLFLSRPQRGAWNYRDQGDESNAYRPASERHVRGSMPRPTANYAASAIRRARLSVCPSRDFLVLHGECLLLVEGQERPLKAWDFVHCPPRTEHVFVGAGSGPCVVLMLGARLPEGDIVYPVSELALKHGAGVETEKHDPRTAYADLPPRRRERLPDLGLPWQ